MIPSGATAQKAQIATGKLAIWFFHEIATFVPTFVVIDWLKIGADK